MIDMRDLALTAILCAFALVAISIAVFVASWMGHTALAIWSWAP